MSEGLKELKIDERSGYGMPDVARLFLLIRKRPMGRTSLIRDLKLGEATVKTMIKFLKSKGLVEQGTKGVHPTRRLSSLLSFCNTLSEIIEVEIPGFSEKPTVALLVKKAADKIKNGIEQRDEGVRFGARIITLARKDGRLMLAGMPEFSADYMKKLERKTDLEDGDVVIVSSAEFMLDAERGAVAAALISS